MSSTALIRPTATTAGRASANTSVRKRRILITSSLAVSVFGIVLAITLTRGGSSKPLMSTSPVAGNAVKTPVDDSPSEEVMLASADPQMQMLTGDVRKTFFGVPLKGETVAYVIDGDSTMAPYIDEVAFITNSVNESITPGSRNFGIVMAINNGGKMQIEVAEPSSNLDGARSVLLARIPGGETRLQSALAATTNWYADQLFIVVSKPIEAKQVEVLSQTAAQTGAVTHVIGLGEAAKQDLSPIAKSTGGQYVAVSNETLDRLVAKHSNAKNGE